MDTDKEGKRVTSTPLPAVVACGQRTVFIPKSGSSFPTFLVSLAVGDGGKQVSQFTVWRSKRDFLRLARAVKSSKSLPKAALKRLAENNIPWVRPGIELFSDQPNNYHVSMKKSILQLDQFLQVAAASSDIGTQQEWEIFCRPQDTDGLIPLENESPDGSQPTSIPASQERQLQSSRLGQYFCISDNAKQVVCTALDTIKEYLEKCSQPVVFLEPSCGHGDIVSMLIQELTERSIPPDRVVIYAYDIDPIAIETCKSLKENDGNYQIHWDCSNFLQTIPPQAPSHNATSHPVVCVGGPPYTTGPGSSVDIQRDLPVKFVQHCLDIWRASSVCFLLPERYKRTAIPTPPMFQRRTISLESSTFLFQGSTPVIQPSIIQCFFSELVVARGEMAGKLS